MEREKTCREKEGRREREKGSCHQLLPVSVLGAALETLSPRGRSERERGRDSSTEKYGEGERQRQGVVAHRSLSPFEARK